MTAAVHKMDNLSLFTAQLTDVFRIGLLAAMLYTTKRNQAQTGVAVPVVAGIVFVAVVISSTMPIANISIGRNIVSGLVANAVITAVLLAAWSAYRSFQK
jgi:hypothetical protein